MVSRCRPKNINMRMCVSEVIPLFFLCFILLSSQPINQIHYEYKTISMENTNNVYPFTETRNSYPLWQVKITLKIKQTICWGAIVSSLNVVTAANCVLNRSKLIDYIR